MSRKLFLAAAVLAVAPWTGAQTLYGFDGGAGAVLEFTSPPAGPCVAPIPALGVFPYVGGICPGLPPLMPVPAGAFVGDIADDPLTDTVYVTDGFMVGQYAGDVPCGPPGAPLNNFPVGAAFGGPVTGMGMDAMGITTGGIPALWLTDGVFFWAIAPSPPGSCAAAPIVMPPCPLPTPIGAPFTDVTVDPFTGTLWACDAAGFVHNFLPGCFPTMAPVFVGAGCGLGPLQGIAYDTGTPNAVTGVGPAVYVTDGFAVAYVDPFTGAFAPPTFYTPVPCFPTPAFLGGLALSQHSVSYGTSRAGATLGTFGQSTSPGPTFGLEITGAPAGTTASFLILNFSFPGPGFFCPGVGGVGTTIWVDPTPPGTVLALGPMGPGCIPIALPIPGAIPPGLEMFAQVVFMGAGGPPALDATQGIAATFSLP